MFMNHYPSSNSHSRRWRRWIPPTVAVGTGGTALVIWFDEVVAFATEFFGLILLPIMAGIIYLFNIYVFKSATPKTDDMNK
jgi:hypothetical protein